MIEFVELAPGDERLAEVYPVLHELRSELSLEAFRERYADGHPDGYRFVAGFQDGACRAVAGYRILVNVHRGRVLYVDDLVTSARHRSKGIGRALMAYLRDRAREAGCDYVSLDSGVQRADAHRFYFREGFVVTSFHFGRACD